MKILILLLLTTQITCAHAKLLDKIAGVINDQVYTYTEIQRIKNTIDARKKISPMIYIHNKYNELEIIKLLQRNYIIKDKLSSMGFVISDDSVESRIMDTERRSGLTRKDLLEFLKSKNLSFNEYFELIREAMEYNVFNLRIIAPLISITEQEVKNFYYTKINKNKNLLNFKYKVVDFFFPKSLVMSDDIEKLPSILTEYQKTGNLPSNYKNVATNDLGELLGEDLPKELNELLKVTNEGSFSKSYVKSDKIHVFFIKSKDLVESSDYLSKKEFIYNEIFLKKSKLISKSWFEKESENYYILENIE